MRQQLPPQIRKIEVLDRRTGRTVVRYQLTVDIGRDRDGKRKQLRRRFASEADARDELSRVQSEVRTGSYVHPSKITVDMACETWLSGKHSLKPSTLRGHEVSLQALRDQLGDVPVQKLTKANLDALVGQLRAGEIEGRRAWSPRSVNYLLYLTGCVLNEQVRLGHLSRNVATFVDRVAGDPKKHRTLTAGEMYKILDHDCRDQHLWALALYGLRRGEVAGLRWANVNLSDETVGDLPPKSIRVTENRVAAGGDVVVGSPKSKASNRTLPMPAEVVTALKAARKRQAAERLLIGEHYGPGEYLAADEAGQPYHPNLLTFRWGKLLDDLKINRVRLHDARHTCATLMHLRGVPIAVVAAWLGHSSAAFTMATYAHSQDDALKAAGQAFTRSDAAGN